MLSNREIAAHLHELARLTTLAEGSPNAFRVRVYESAARAVETHPDPVAAMTPGEMTALRGVGKSTAAKIKQLVDEGRIDKLEELRRLFPPDFVELIRIPGLGPKTVVMLRTELGIASVADLRVALDRQELRDLPGLGPKTEAKITAALDRLGAHDERTPIAVAMRLADDITEVLAAVDGVVRAEPMGSLRRFRETIGDVDVVVASNGDPAAVMDRLVASPLIAEVIGHGPAKTSVVTGSGIQIDVRVVRPEQFGSAALYFTGSKAHNIRLRQMAIDRDWILNEYGLSDHEGIVVAAEAEEAIYSALGLPWITPEIREDDGEIEAALAGELPPPITTADLRGDLHVHTSLSGDGDDDLIEMVDAAKKRDYTYLAITDHGEDLAINGASRGQMLEQRERIADLRRRNRKLRILHGVELNIGRDGTVDYDPEFLAGFDWGVASVHSHFDLDPVEQTDRILAAMFNPAVNAIGHLTGRRIGRRPGIEFDSEAVLAGAERSGCAIEINSNLDRLDAPVRFLRRARERDVRFVISTDSHRVSEFAFCEYGVRQARRGWVDPSQIANTWDRDRFLKWAAAKRSG